VNLEGAIKEIQSTHTIKDACRSRADSPIVSKGAEVRKPGGVEAVDPTASVVEVAVSDGDM
jgi:hypothetical protein